MNFDPLNHSMPLNKFLNKFGTKFLQLFPALKFYHHQVSHVLLSVSSTNCLVLCFIFTYNSDVYCDEIEHLILQFNFERYKL